MDHGSERKDLYSHALGRDSEIPSFETAHQRDNWSF